MDLEGFLRRASGVYKKQRVPFESGSKQLKTLFTLHFKINVVAYSFRLLEDELGAVESRLDVYKQNGARQEYLIPLMYHFEGFLLQARIAMDFWAKFLAVLPGFDNLGETFTKHRKNIGRIEDQRYRDYVAGMDWFDEMKATRDAVKSGKIVVPMYDDRLQGIALFRMTYGRSRAERETPRRRLGEYVTTVYSRFEAYVEFVLDHLG